MIQARVEYDTNYAVDRVIVVNDQRQRLGVENGYLVWVSLEELHRESPKQETPFLRFTDESAARALYSALAAHFGGTADGRLRKDYEAERARVDKMIDGLLAQPLTVSSQDDTIVVARSSELQVSDLRRRGESDG